MKVRRILELIVKEYQCYVTALMIGINVIVFGLMLAEHPGVDGFAAYDMEHWGAMVSGALEKGEYYRLFTSMFLHFDLKHLGNNMLVLAVIGSSTEWYMGSLSFALVYLLGGLGGNIVSELMYAYDGVNVVSAGASGAVFAVVGALLCVVIFNKGRLENFTTSKVIVFIVLTLYQGVSNTGVDNYAHVGGLITGFIVAVICCIVRRRHDDTSWGDFGGTVEGSGPDMGSF